MFIRDLSGEVPGLLLTAARFGIAEDMARRVRNDESIAAEMVAFIGADIADGGVLRQAGRDTPLRRVADGVVDHLSVARVAYEVGKKQPETQVYIGILATRAAVVGTLNTLHFALTGEVTKGQWNQKVKNLASAAFALIATTGNRRAIHAAGILTSGVSIITTTAHFKDIGIKHASGIREL